MIIKCGIAKNFLTVVVLTYMMAIKKAFWKFIWIKIKKIIKLFRIHAFNLFNFYCL